MAKMIGFSMSDNVVRVDFRVEASTADALAFLSEIQRAYGGDVAPGKNVPISGPERTVTIAGTDIRVKEYGTHDFVASATVAGAPVERRAASASEALEGVVRVIQPATSPAAPPAKPAPASVQETPAAAVGEVPPGLASATTFRQVINWMLSPDGGGLSLVDPNVAQEIATRCEAWRGQVPVLGRVTGSLADRAARAVEVLRAEQNA